MTNHTHPAKSSAMKRTIALLALAAAPLIAADEVPLQFGNNMQRNAVVEARDLPAQLGDHNTLWKIDLHDKPYYNSVQIVGDRGYAAMDARNLPSGTAKQRSAGLLCFNIHTGEILWEKDLGYRLSAWGASIVPMFFDDKIYIGAQSMALCLDMDGNELWATDTAGDYFSDVHGVHGTGVIIGDYWWYPTGFSNGTDCDYWAEASIERPWHPNIVIIDRRSGEIVAQDDVVLNPHQHGTWGSLSLGEVAGKPAVFWGDSHGYVHAFDASEPYTGSDGDRATIRKLWTTDGNPESYRLTEDGVPWVYAYYSGKWGPRDKGPNELIAPLTYHEGRIYVSIGRDKAYVGNEGNRYHGDGALVCIDVTGPEPREVWANTEIGRTFCPPSIKDGLAHVATHSGYLNTIDIETGETLRKEDMNACIWNFFQSEGDGKIYVMNERRDFIVFDAKNGGILSNYLADATNNPQVGMTHGLLIVSTMKSIAGYGGPEYMATHAPMPAPADPKDRQLTPQPTGEFDSRAARGGH